MIDPILMCKTRCNGDKYFSIFENHLPELKAGSDICMYDISNELCIMHIIDRYPNCNYYISDIPEIITSFKILRPELKLNLVEDKNKTFDIDMKFDCVIMNPPYQKNLHLKILAEAIKHLKDDDSVCVNLSPDNWITNPFKMFEKERLKREALTSIGNYIKDYTSITQNEFNTLFDTNSYFGIGIIVCGLQRTGFDCSKWNSTNKLLLKVLEKVINLPTLRSKFSRRIDDDKFVPVRRRTHKTYTYCEINDTDIKSKEGILFNTISEAQNFKHCIISSWFYRWLDTTEWDDSENSAEVPWLGDAINPRTGLKGYEGEWTDEDLYKFFNITEDERKIIEETMAKYK